MDDAVDGGVLGEDLVESLLVGDVDLVKIGAAACQQLDPVNRHLGRVVEAVDNDDIVAGVEQGQSREGADVARATADWAQRNMLVQDPGAKIRHGQTPRRRSPNSTQVGASSRSCVGQRGAISAHICWAEHRRVEHGRTDGENGEAVPGDENSSDSHCC